MNAILALSARTLADDGAFVVPYLRPSIAVLDCGCGPGSISLGIADLVAPGVVVGVDSDAAQIERARDLLRRQDLASLSFEIADVYDLPFESESFDLVFSNALMQHLAWPDRALAEMYRVLRSSGILALRSPDWGALFITPRSTSLMSSFDRFIEIYYRDGSPYAGSNMSVHARTAGFDGIAINVVTKSESTRGLAEFIAGRLSRAGFVIDAEQITRWGDAENAYFAQIWGELVAKKPPIDRAGVENSEAARYLVQSVLTVDK